jgi:hypothetical protein
MNDATAVPFDPDALAARLPAGALRYLTHAIRSGAAIPRTAQIGFTDQPPCGHAGPWLRFRARETLEPPPGCPLRPSVAGPLPVIPTTAT